jgi:hypothetical protein
MTTYPFPIRREGGVIFARLILPNDLKLREADLIAAFIKATTVDAQSEPERRQLPPPSHVNSQQAQNETS